MYSLRFTIKSMYKFVTHTAVNMYGISLYWIVLFALQQQLIFIIITNMLQ